MLISFSLKKVTLKVITAIGQLRFELTLIKGNGQTQKKLLQITLIPGPTPDKSTVVE